MKEEYDVVSKRTERDYILILFLVFLGWLGIDKIYFYRSFKKSWKLMFVKLIFNIALIGILWNLFDIVMAFLGKYEGDFREYFK